VPVKIEPFHLGHFDAVGPVGSTSFTNSPRHFTFKVGGVHTISPDVLSRHANSKAQLPFLLLIGLLSPCSQ
jgi:hypothetical protein